MRSMNRYLNKLAKRRELKLAQHIEHLGAAFCREVGIPATRACLCASTDPETGVRRYWYQEHTERVDVSKSHPDVEALVSAAADVCDGRPGAREAMQEILRRFV